MAFLDFDSYGGGLLCPDPENKTMVDRLISNLVQDIVWIIIVNMKNLSDWLSYV